MIAVTFNIPDFWAGFASGVILSIVLFIIIVVIVSRRLGAN